MTTINSNINNGNYYIIADHLRTIIFALADGAIFESKGRESLQTVSEKLIVLNSSYYPYLLEKKDLIISDVKQELTKSRRLISGAIDQLNNYYSPSITAQDTYLAQKNHPFPTTTFNELLTQQKEKGHADRYVQMPKFYLYMPELENIRNIGIAGHIDHGKTTITEQILYLAGGTHNVGRVDEGSHIDFTAEVERCLRVLDGTIIMIDGQTGVKPQTKKVWRQANKYGIPRLIFVNKMDKIGANFFTTLNSIKEKLNALPLVCQLPIGSENNLQGVIDLIEKKAYYYRLGNVHYYRQELLEKIIEYDEKLGNKYLNEEELTVGEMKYLLRKATLSGKCYPVFSGSAFKNVGVKFLLNGIVDYLPSPQDAPAVLVSRFEKNTAQLEKNTEIILANSYVYNINQRKKERISRLVRVYANKTEEIKQVGVGDIAAAYGLRQTVTGDTLGIEFDEPVISRAVEAKSNKDNDKLSEVLKKLTVQDPGLKYQIDKKTGQILLSGRGELHLETSIERLREKYGIEVNTGQPKISYLETITKPALIKSEYIKQSGGRGHFARVFIQFEPISTEPKERGKRELEFLNKIRGEAIPKEFAEYVKVGLEEALAAGLLLSYKTVDVKATLIDGKTHPVDSRKEDFKEAAVLAFRGDSEEERRKRKLELGMVLLEPIMELEVTIPENYYGDVLNDIISRKGVIDKVDRSEKDPIIQAYVPLANLLNYNADLLDATGGEGIFNMELSYYQEVPSDTLTKLIKEKQLIT
ncbi:10878_t:CDS:2 [Racocetra fulgida]|uniref:10878_t:CDS:1 n=1 Tax=Racocetra fulgida TaxID=60492 RepID=A0A9N8VH96_9GLOM|nr:10878_t:CDS:2 [Racocetra fulgida]